MPFYSPFMAPLRLISFDVCPYVQRSTIALEEKGVDYEIEYIDLADKPDWFLAISPHGKVPVLQVGDAVLFESTVILEYLDETQSPRLHPEDPLERARDRAWFSVADAAKVDLYKMMVAKDRDSLESSAAALRKRFAQLEAQVHGPLWRDAFCAMDAISYPALQRARWLADLHPDLQLFDGVPKVEAWESTLSVRPSVRGSTVPDIHERFVNGIRQWGEVHG